MDLLEKLKVTHLVRKFPAFYETVRFTTLFTTDSHFTEVLCNIS
jgi:hypothetical protein